MVSCPKAMPAAAMNKIGTIYECLTDMSSTHDCLVIQAIPVGTRCARTDVPHTPAWELTEKLQGVRRGPLAETVGIYDRKGDRFRGARPNRYVNRRGPGLISQQHI